MAGKHGGAWKVAYADFVTAMMAFFLVMWITAQSKPVKQAIAQYFNDPWKTSPQPTGDASGGSSPLPGKNATQPAGNSLMPYPRPGNGVNHPPMRPGSPTRGRQPIAAEAGAAKKKAEAATADRSSLFLVHSGDQQRVGTLVLFSEGSSAMDADSRERLKRLAAEIRGLPHKIEIRGHATRCPATPGGPPQDAWALSYARCLSTMRFLKQQGIEEGRMRLSQGGPYEPFSLDTDPAKLAFNSRVEVQMLSELAEDSMGTPEERAKRFTQSQ